MEGSSNLARTPRDRPTGASGFFVERTWFPKFGTLPFLPASCQRPTTSARSRHRHCRTSENTRLPNGPSTTQPIDTGETVFALYQEYFLGHSGGCGESARNLVTWISTSTWNLAQRISSSLHRARASLGHVHLVAWRDGLPPSPPRPLPSLSSPLLLLLTITTTHHHHHQQAFDSRLPFRVARGFSVVELDQEANGGPPQRCGGGSDGCDRCFGSSGPRLWCEAARVARTEDCELRKAAGPPEGAPAASGGAVCPVLRGSLAGCANAVVLMIASKRRPSPSSSKRPTSRRPSWTRGRKRRRRWSRGVRKTRRRRACLEEWGNRRKRKKKRKKKLPKSSHAQLAREILDLFHEPLA